MTLLNEKFDLHISKGWSDADREGDILFDPESSQAFCETLEKSLKSDVKVIKVDLHINDKEFAHEAAEKISSALNANVTLTVGIHRDNIDEEGIQSVIENSR